ncbi:Acetyl-CoA dehydrogenase-like C-terminal domain containing protein [Desulfosarcina cetonica]|uniref:acyl-CoA dehydrogenase n=1 Tax=Desulfosarcina cetonica TaxID=90730 RepID=UPI0006D2BDCF|nr:acyl-CoA dehydrogenase [Desulfosarcina cetonica]VTR67803.1 Acetyl-CoA dehydrogenase-like C-terminal domain containing protein [Desulfosarcina cetonica]
MAQLIADRRDVDFVLHEQLDVDVLSKQAKYAEFSRKTIDLIISEARNLAIKEILPTFKEGDEEGCRFENGQVFVPESFKRAYDLFIEGEWLAMTEDPAFGGQGMPRTVALAAGDYFNGANYAFMMYPGLTHGAALLVESFGTERQKQLFLKNMFTGKWTGTMLLTEPEAGSDVGNLSTSARKNPDGTYSITGNKIFISSGEHDMVENIVHPVLARIEGAPAGTKGISLFLVPKYRVNADGSLGEFNDVVCTGIEHKMGINGNATCSLTLGGKGNCVGELLGEENKGMRAMFLMMNEARLLVGMQGFCCASASYMNALNYARERVQGKSLLQAMDADAPSVPIIQHPDVRRMLLSMKAYVEGMRSLLYYTGFLTDRIAVSDNEKEKSRLQGMIDLLIPICKGYVTDKSFEVCSTGIQVYGGYGFTKEYPQEQLLRDCRITMIYEGTNGIQAMDLLGRKLGMNKGKPIMDLMGEIQKTLAAAKAFENLGDLAARLEKALNRLAEVAMHLGATAMSPKVMQAFAFAHPFLDASGDVVMAWMLLWRAVIAATELEKGAKKKDQAFYEGQIKSCQYFTQAVLPVTMGKMDAIMTTCPAAVEISDEAFGGK